jgi:hypothetical protein
MYTLAAESFVGKNSRMEIAAISIRLFVVDSKTLAFNIA